MNKEETLDLIKELLKECNISNCFFKNKMGMLKVTLGINEYFFFDSSLSKLVIFAIKPNKRLELNLKKAQIEQALSQLSFTQLETIGVSTYSIINDHINENVSIATIGEYNSFFN